MVFSGYEHSPGNCLEMRFFFLPSAGMCKVFMPKIIQKYSKCLIRMILPSPFLRKCWLIQQFTFSLLRKMEKPLGCILCKLIDRPENPFTFAGANPAH